MEQTVILLDKQKQLLFLLDLKDYRYIIDQTTDGLVHMPIIYWVVMYLRISDKKMDRKCNAKMKYF